MTTTFTLDQNRYIISNMKQIMLNRREKEEYSYEYCDNKLSFSETLWYRYKEDLLEKIDQTKKRKVKKLIRARDNYTFINHILSMYLEKRFERANYRLRLSDDPPYLFYHVLFKNRHFALAPFKSYLVTDGEETSEGVELVVDLYLYLYPKLLNFYEKNPNKFSDGFKKEFDKHLVKAREILNS